ncbi:hypothetical protein H5410_063905 [Solanum commersonii]|uniref:DDE Tnp4 domain-containing protein n=1 Tax=Solanum commersonii TaxID=4109 RepID=A0A9J5WEH5_SOLCO|nr:hypothetical protein H5410_063905 [Solanum commersonii]
MDSQQLCDVECFMILEEIVVHSYIVLICFFMAIYSMLLRNQSRNRRVIRYCMSARIPKILSHLNVLIRDNDIVCIDKLRMDRNAFHILASLAKNIGGSVKVDYIRSGWSVSRAFNECLRAILKLTPLLLVKPNPVLEDDTDDRWKWFKGCLGALDGTYISIRVEAIYKPRYRTRKGDIATNVLGFVIEISTSFMYYLVGRDQPLMVAYCEMLYKKWVESNYYLCDGGYTNGNGFLSPYRGYRYWLKDWQGDNPSPQCREELFNMKHASASNVIERAFGLLKGRVGEFLEVLRGTRLREMEADPLDVEMEFHMENQHEHDNINTIEASDEWTTWRDEHGKELCNNIAAKESSGLGFQYSDGSILVDDPKAWDDLIKRRSSRQEEPNVSTGATQSPFTTQDEPNESTGAAQSSFTTQKGETHQSQKQGNSFKASSSKVNEKGRCKKRKTTEDDNETVLKGLMEVMKQFESHDKRMASLIDKLGERDLSEIRGKIFSIIGSPAFEIYNSDERVKAAMGITQDIKRMEFFLSISELERHSMIWMIINDKL